MSARASAVPADEVASSRSQGLRTEFAFVLPRGYIDDAGTVHRDGIMRLATAKDEILPQRDPRVRENESYLTVLLLSRVITRLGTVPAMTPGVVEGMFASDLAFLQDLYRRINQDGVTELALTCPSCKEEITVDLAGERSGDRDVRDRPALRGDRVRVLPLPLVARRDPRTGASRPTAFRQRDRRDQPSCLRR